MAKEFIKMPDNCGMVVHGSDIAAHNAIGVGECDQPILRHILAAVLKSDQTIGAPQALRLAIKVLIHTTRNHGLVPFLLVFCSMLRFVHPTAPSCRPRYVPRWHREERGPPHRVQVSHQPSPAGQANSGCTVGTGPRRRGTSIPGTIPRIGWSIQGDPPRLQVSLDYGREEGEGFPYIGSYFYFCPVP